jgi:hypothetical protein
LCTIRHHERRVREAKHVVLCVHVLSSLDLDVFAGIERAHLKRSSPPHLVSTNYR